MTLTAQLLVFAGVGISMFLVGLFWRGAAHNESSRTAGHGGSTEAGHAAARQQSQV